MLQQQHIIPFTIVQQLIMPPCIIMHRLLSISADVLSSQVQTTFIPPLTFSIFIVQRGVIIPPLMPIGIPVIEGIDPIPGIMPIDPVPGIPIPVIRSLVIMLLIANSFMVIGSLSHLRLVLLDRFQLCARTLVLTSDHCQQQLTHCPADQARGRAQTPRKQELKSM
jgi:hypothetical protein